MIPKDTLDQWKEELQNQADIIINMVNKYGRENWTQYDPYAPLSSAMMQLRATQECLSIIQYFINKE